MTQLLRAMKDDGGTSLTELSVAVTILGGVSAAALIALTPLTRDAETVACKANQDMVHVAGVAFMSQDPLGSPAPSMRVLLATGFLGSVPPDVFYLATDDSFEVGGTGPCEP